MRLDIRSVLPVGVLALATAMAPAHAETKHEMPAAKVGEHMQSLTLTQAVQGLDQTKAVTPVPMTDIGANRRLTDDPTALGFSAVIEDHPVGAPPSLVTFVCERGNTGRFAIEDYRGFARIRIDGRMAEGPLTFVRDGIYRGFQGWVYVADGTDLYFFLANERDSYSELWPVWFFFAGREPALYCLAS